MPPKHVYGKRSKAIYDPLAVFGSPQSTERLVKDKDDAATELAKQVHKLEIRGAEHGEHKQPKLHRRALDERDANNQVESEVKKTERKGRRRKVEKVEGRRNDEDVIILDNTTAQFTAENAFEELTGTEVPVNDAQEVKPAELRSLPLLEQLSTAQEDKENNGPVEDVQYDDTKADTVARNPYATHQNASVHATHDQEWSLPTSPIRNVYTHHCQPLLALSSHPMTDFAKWSEQLASHFSLTKIAEASFGEVYRISFLEHIPGLTRSDESVFKVIALKSPASTLSREAKRRKAALKKAEAMSKVEDVANEVKLLQRMSSIPGYTNFRDVRILQGRPPPLFIEAFHSWNEGQKARKKDASVFPDPAKKTSYGDDQLWAVVEMQDAGIDLERYIEAGQVREIWTIWDVFWQVICSLAKGEQGAEFEHRDLHLGNICVRSASSSCSTSEGTTIDVKKKLGFTRLETTIIDYTISRCIMPSHDIAFTDLAHPAQTSLFEGDSTEEYQYDIYRYMRGAALLADPMADFSSPEAQAASAQAISDGRGWKAYHPVTNLVWLHFVLYKLLEQVRWPSKQKAPPKKSKPREHAAWKRANDLEHKLLRVQNLLDPETVCARESPIRSASDLVDLALTEGWLDVADVVGEVSVGDGDCGERAEGVESVEGETGYSSELCEKLAGLKVRVDLIEECGLEIAEEEARANTRKVRKGRERR
ncbi:hypothetical protein Tdes44962_MAKER08067 [Teratosphaeria destructans]|uniref:non-specific serine/threonine protein kinase n=1 Tax=Teratosphaeria destructans TaxID=418781 RepID=A0A9W7SXJ7_9PEZI|nr:hypothetical protein Tdes44962_MAKER08067 [Teratosphaeria destructans]